MSKIALQVNKPCSEDWQQMKPSADGRYCHTCQSPVIDFTSWSEQEIKAFFIKQRHNLCGRFRQEQLKEYSLTTPGFAWLNKIAASIVGLGFSTGYIAANPQAELRHKAPSSQYMQFVTNTLQPPTDSTFITISGLVRDGYDSIPIPGVIVEERGTPNKTTTDMNGRFELRISNHAGTRLIISFIGYETKEVIPLATQRNDIMLQTTFHLQDVVLTHVIAGGIAVKASPLRRMWWKIKDLFN